MTKTKTKLTYIFLLLACLVATTQLIISCANIGSPDGGLYDETPPKIVKTSPAYGSINSKDRKITLTFDEFVKLENASENIIVSPPQIEQPEVNQSGKKVTVELKDTLKPNYTYTVDFGNCIVDNNEGNPMGEYAFTFSTGEKIDSLQVSGKVINAENHEPIKGMLVGLYKIEVSDSTEVHEKDSLHYTPGFPDSIFTTRPLERIGRTDGSGHFVIKGIAEGEYRVFALNDQDQNYTYSQKSEMMAFSDRIIRPTVSPDVRLDTLWHDSIHYIRIDTVYYKHYFPDDIELRAFTTNSSPDRYIIKSERPQLENLCFIFSSPSDTLPKLKGLNFDISDSTFVVEASQHNDTLTYWIRDSLIYNLDTLSIQLDYYATDTAGMLAVVQDTLFLVSKISKKAIAKEKKERMEEWVEKYKDKIKAQRRAKEMEEEAKAKEEAEAQGKKYKKEKKDRKKKGEDDEDIEVPPMPDPPLELKFTPNGGLSPDNNLTFEATEPIEKIDTSKIRFSIKVDTLSFPARHIIHKVDGTLNKYRIYAEWQPDSTYEIEMDSGAVVSIYGKLSEAQKKPVKVKSLNQFSTLFVALTDADTSAIVELLSSQEKVVKSKKVEDGRADFYFVNPQTYYLRMFYDRNGNGVWDTGDYERQIQPEEMFYYTQAIQLKAQWEITQTWNPTSTPLISQKPKAITKQKPDKEKQIKHRNAEKLAERAKRKNKKQ